MNATSEWRPREEAYDFRTPAFAIDLCMMRRLRKVRIIIDSGDPAQDIALEVQGSEKLALAETMTTHQQLRQRQRALAAELSAVQAEKERKKQFPFKRKRIGTDENQASQ